MDLYLSKNTLCNLVSDSLSHTLYGARKYPENRLIGAINFLAFRILFGLTMQYSPPSDLIINSYLLLPIETEDLTFQRLSVKIERYLGVPLERAQALFRIAHLTLTIAATILLMRYCSSLVRVCCNSPSAKPFSVSPWDHLHIIVLNYIIKKVVHGLTMD